MKETAKNSNYWLVSGFMTILQNFSGVFFGFAGFFILVRLLTKQEYGVWVLFMSTITILEAIRTGLIQTALIRYLSASDDEGRPVIMTASALLSGIVTLVCVLASLVFSGILARLWDSPQLVTLFLVYNLGFILSGILNLFNWLEQASFRFKGVFFTGLVRQVIFFAFVGGAYFFNYKIQLVQLVWVQVISIALATGLAYYYVRLHLQFSMVGVGDWLKKLFGYGKYGFGTSVSSLLSGTLDQMMLGAMLSPAASGAFNIAVRITNLIDIPTNAMAVIVFPQSARRMAEEGKDAIKYLYEKSVGTTLAILLPGVLFLYFFADWTISLIAGEKYDDSIPLLKITLMYSLLIPFGRQFGTILDSIGKTKVTFYVVLITTLVNLGLNYYFIGWLGVLGAAYATLVSNIIGFMIAQVILKREVSVNVLNTFVYMYQFYPDFYQKYIRPFYLKTFTRANK